MPQTETKVGPQDHGRRMSLAEFDKAEAQEGYLYELGRGVIVVSDVPNKRHLVQLLAIQRQFARYDLDHPGRIYGIVGGSDCKMLLWDLESERHPDLTVYKSPPPPKDMWSTWIPDLVIEVVSPGSEERDYVEKREEYLRFGVKEYWIIDADKAEVLVLRRAAGSWKPRVLGRTDTYRPRSLPGFEFDCAPVFDAADKASR